MEEPNVVEDRASNKLPFFQLLSAIEEERWCVLRHRGGRMVGGGGVSEDDGEGEDGEGGW